MASQDQGQIGGPVPLDKSEAVVKGRGFPGGAAGTANESESRRALLSD